MDKTYRNSNYKNVTTYRLVLLVLLVKHILRFLWANQDSNQKSVDSKHRILISKHVRIDNSFALYFETVLVLQCPKFEAIIEKNVKRKTSCVFNCMHCYVINHESARAKICIVDLSNWPPLCTIVILYMVEKCNSIKIRSVNVMLSPKVYIILHD